GVRRALDAVIWPQHLRAVRQLDRLERLLAGMARRERDVALRVPVLRDLDVTERGRESIDDRHHLVSVENRERPAGHEAVLYVDDDEHVIVAESQPAAIERHGTSRVPVR